MSTSPRLWAGGAARGWTRGRCILTVDSARWRLTLYVRGASPHPAADQEIAREAP